VECGEQPLAAICRAQGITETTCTRWRKQYGDLTVAQARLREWERENVRLKRLLAERDLELDAAQELLAKKSANAAWLGAKPCGFWLSARSRSGVPALGRGQSRRWAVPSAGAHRRRGSLIPRRPG
jgi:putative transposase